MTRLLGKLGILTLPIPQDATMLKINKLVAILIALVAPALWTVTASPADAATCRYLKHPWAAAVYQVCGSSAAHWITAAQYAALGRPPITVIYRIPGDQITRNITHPEERFVRPPDEPGKPFAEPLHRLSSAEYTAMGRPAVQAISLAAYWRLSNGEIWLQFTDGGACSEHLTPSAWAFEGYPTPVAASRIPGRCSNV